MFVLIFVSKRAARIAGKIPNMVRISQSDPKERSDEFKFGIFEVSPFGRQRQEELLAAGDNAACHRNRSGARIRRNRVVRHGDDLAVS